MQVVWESGAPLFTGQALGYVDSRFRGSYSVNLVATVLAQFAPSRS